MRAAAGVLQPQGVVLTPCTRLPCVTRSADRLEYAEEYNLGNDTFPFVFTSTAPIEALHPRLCTDSVGCPPKRWELTAESLRVWPASYTNVSGWGAEEPLSTWSVLRNETISGYFFVNATANQTQLVVQNNTFLISTAASSGVTRLLVSLPPLSLMHARAIATPSRHRPVERARRLTHVHAAVWRAPGARAAERRVGLRLPAAADQLRVG